MAGLVERSLEESLARLRLERVDVFFLHNLLVGPDDIANGVVGTSRATFAEAVHPAFEALIASGRVGAWGITGIGVPSAVIETLFDARQPAAVQCVTNLLDSAGGMRRYEASARPRDIIAAATEARVGVMGIRAVQDGALTDGIDRALPPEHPEVRDFERARPFRDTARELGTTPALLAHRYALGMSGVATVVLGVKSRTELRECLEAEAQGPLEPELVARIDAAVGRA